MYWCLYYDETSNTVVLCCTLSQRNISYNNNCLKWKLLITLQTRKYEFCQLMPRNISQYYSGAVVLLLLCSMYGINIPTKMIMNFSGKRNDTNNYCEDSVLSFHEFQ